MMMLWNIQFYKYKYNAILTLSLSYLQVQGLVNMNTVLVLNLIGSQNVFIPVPQTSRRLALGFCHFFCFIVNVILHTYFHMIAETESYSLLYLCLNLRYFKKYQFKEFLKYVFHIPGNL